MSRLASLDMEAFQNHNPMRNARRELQTETENGEKHATRSHNSIKFDADNGLGVQKQSESSGSYERAVNSRRRDASSRGQPCSRHFAH